MKLCLALLPIMWGSAANCLAQTQNGPDADPNLLRFTEQVLPVLAEHCLDCHSAENTEGNVRLDQVELVTDQALWHRVLKNVRADIMPPHSHSKLAESKKLLLTQWVTHSVFGVDSDNLPAGYVAARRLNRTEYRNTVRDLMGIDFNAEVVFPPDDTGFGFDNVGQSLGLSPMMLEKYVTAAKAIVDEAVPRHTWSAPRKRWSGSDIRNAENGSNAGFLRIEKPVTLKLKVVIEHAGDYSLTINQRLHGSFDYRPTTYHVRAALDQTELFQADYKWEEGKQVVHNSTHQFEAGEYQIEIDISQIEQGKDAVPKENDDTFVAYQIVSLIIEGPSDPQLRVHPEGYGKFFDMIEPPQEPTQRSHYASKLLENFATRAFRRPVTESSLERLVKIAEQTWQEPETTFEEGVARAMTAVLASPRFLLKQDAIEAAHSDGLNAPVDEYSLACRLSYFLWSTMPDRQLWELAQAGRLRNDLDLQLTRMLADDRAKAFTRNFVGQWLRTRDVESTSIDAIAASGHQSEFEALRKQFTGRMRRSPGEQLSPEDEAARKRFRELIQLRDQIDASVRSAMRQETEMMFDYLVHENRSLLELIDSDYSFINDKLAKLYGIEGVQGGEMRRVSLGSGSHRGGVLTQGTMLVVTSNSTRTSPVKRGLYILDNLLGTPAPPAPAAVPALEDSADRFNGREPSLRELLSVHRESPLCASCHSRMDPLGLALENYNAFGLYRERDGVNEIDAAGELITGEKFKNVEELKQILSTTRKRDFYRCVTEKMLVYALGRGLDYHDEATLESIVNQLDAQQGKVGELVRLIVRSAPFQKQQLTPPSIAVSE